MRKNCKDAKKKAKTPTFEEDRRVWNCKGFLGYKNTQMPDNGHIYFLNGVVQVPLRNKKMLRFLEGHKGNLLQRIK